MIEDPPVLIGILTPIEPAKMYEGESDVYPTDEEIILHVKGKRMPFDIVIHPTPDPRVPYEGSYEVDPEYIQQTLPTNGKTLSQDIIINPITGELIPDIYSGPYDIEATVEDQTFATRGFLMQDDIHLAARPADPDPYEGSYNITPNPFQKTTLPTDERLMAENLVINAVSNGRYTGPRDIVPSDEGVFLPTNGVFMEDMLYVAPIPYMEVANPSGGYTVTIGGSL